VCARRLKLDHLALLLAGRTAAQKEKQAGTGHLRRQQTTRLPAAPDPLAVAHLARRASLASKPSTATRRLDEMVEQTLGFDGVLALHRAIAVLENRAIPERLGALGERVNALIPAPEEVKRLGADVGKRLLVDNVDPVLALSMATKESAAHFERLKDWESLSPKERLLTTTGLTANLAEIVGVVSPPPINVGAQLAAVGLQLVTMATEHSESIEGVTQRVKAAEPTRRVLDHVAGRRGVLAQRVEDAWVTLASRLARQGPRRRGPWLHPYVQRLFASSLFRQLKRQRLTRRAVHTLEQTILRLLRFLRF
jgi:hypothetical protein